MPRIPSDALFTFPARLLLQVRLLDPAACREYVGQREKSSSEERVPHRDEHIRSSDGWEDANKLDALVLGRLPFQGIELALNEAALG